MPVESDVRLGHGVVIFHPELVNLYGCRIGDGTRIGSFVEIQKNAAIGKNCKISSHSFICEGVEIEDEVFVPTFAAWPAALRQPAPPATLAQRPALT